MNLYEIQYAGAFMTAESYHKNADESLRSAGATQS